VRQARIGILGATGAVGKVTTAMVHARMPACLRLGVRDADRARLAFSDGLAATAEVAVLDLDQPRTIARFTAGCDVVVNCAGPSCRIMDRVAIAAANAGAHYVDPEAVYQCLTSAGAGLGTLTAVLSAGLTPGLSGLLLRALASGFTECDTAEVFAGGRGPMTAAAAEDYLTAADPRIGESWAAWRNGRAVSRALSPSPLRQLPYFPGLVSAHPYLSQESVRLAQSIGLRDLSWYTVFDGEQLTAVLAQGHAAVTAEQVRRAARIDSAGRDSYQLFLLRLVGRCGDAACARTIVARCNDASSITGAVTTFAVGEIVAGRVAQGIHFASEILDPMALIGALREAGIAAVHQADAIPDQGGLVEDGVL